MYMAVSETAKSHGKSGSISRAGRKTAAILLAVLALTAGAGTVSLAADNTAGSGDGVAVGTGSSAPKAENVAIGKGAGISYSNGASTATGDIVVGSGANINNYASQGGSIAIGKNAKVENMAGGGEASFAFGQTTFSGGWWSSSRIPADPSKVVGSIAIGDNTFARTGSTMIGSHNYKGELGDTTVDSTSTRTYALNVYATTVGANSFSNGAFTTNTGSYNIISSNYDGGRLANPVKNMGATITGALNSIESIKGAGYYSGIANTVSGIANRTSNSNGTLIYGAGNEVTNSITSLTGTPTDSGNSAKEFSEKLRNAIKASNSGGATLVIGGANVADYTQKTQIIGVNNKVTGTSDKISDYNMINGYGITVTGASHLYTTGTNNTITNAKDTILFGDNRKAEGVDNSVIIGNADEKTPITTEKKDTVILGHNANATIDGGVALGAGSVASVDKASVDQNAIGYDPVTKKASNDTSSTWKSTAAAVSVGDASKNITRQITNVAAGAQDTDAVNVAQLKAAQTHFYSVNSTDEKAGNYNNDGAKGTNSLAAGVGALANGNDSVAIGTKAKAQNDALAVGDSARAGNNSIAIGMNASAGYSQNMALGYYANVANGVTNSTALGYGSQVTKRDILKSDGNDGVISVGKSVGQSGEKGMTRRIINVKAGVKATDAANVSQLTELKEGEHISITDSATPNEKGQTVKTISVKVDGQIEKGNTGILSGDTVYKEVHVDKDGNYIKSGYTVAENLNALDGKVKTNADNIEKNGQAIEKNSARIDTNAKNIEKNSQAIEKNSARIDTNAKNIEKNSQAIEKNSARIDTNAKNIEKNSQAIEKNSARIDTNAKNIEKNGQAIEKNSARIDTNSKNIEKNSQAIEKTSALVQTNAQNIEKNGEAIEKNSGRIDTNSKNIETLQKTKADTNLSNITDAGKTVINNIAKKSVKVEAGSSNVSVTENDVADGPITYTVDIAKDLNINSITAKVVTSDTTTTKNLSVSEMASIGDVTINKGNQGTVNGLKNKTWDPTKITSGQAATEDQLQAATKNAINYDGDNSKTITLREDTTIKNVADTAIEQGSKNAVNAGTVYNETRVAKDGTFVKQSNTAGENLTALDNQVASNTGAVNELNGRVNRLDSRVNKVGAGAAALAALHPLDYDPQDKWDFAAGVGNYRNATAAAVGLFYRPNERTMFNLGWTMGDNRNMVNGGFSLKFGKSNKYIKYSKAEMAAVIDNQSREIAELKAKDAQNAKDNAEMKAEIEALKKQVEALAARK